MQALEQPALTPVQQSVADTAVHNPADSVTPSAAAAGEHLFFPAHIV